MSSRKLLEWNCTQSRGTSSFFAETHDIIEQYIKSDCSLMRFDWTGSFWFLCNERFSQVFAFMYLYVYILVSFFDIYVYLKSVSFLPPSRSDASMFEDGYLIFLWPFTPLAMSSITPACCDLYRFIIQGVSSGPPFSPNCPLCWISWRARVRSMVMGLMLSPRPGGICGVLFQDLSSILHYSPIFYNFPFFPKRCFKDFQTIWMGLEGYGLNNNFWMETTWNHRCCKGVWCKVYIRLLSYTWEIWNLWYDKSRLAAKFDWLCTQYSVDQCGCRLAVGMVPLVIAVVFNLVLGLRGAKHVEDDLDWIALFCHVVCATKLPFHLCCWAESVGQECANTIWKHDFDRLWII